MKAHIEPSPLGVAGIIGPWNFPLNLVVLPAAAAFAAGNRVMIKMSEITPRTAALMKELAPKYFDATELAVVTDGRDVAAAFSELPFDHLFFTGFNIAMPIQPGHGVRRNAWPPYPDTDPLVNVAGMMRTVSEVRAVIRWLAPQSTAIALSGLSLGSAVAALVSSREESVDAVALYTPILGLKAMIANHLHRWGGAADEVEGVLDSADVAALTAVIDPLAVVPLAPPERRLIVGAWHDQMAMRAPALALHELWGGELYWHDGGHVGHIFSGRVQTVTERFLRRVAADARSGRP